MNSRGILLIAVGAVVLIGSGACNSRRASNRSASTSHTAHAEWRQRDSVRFDETAVTLLNRRIVWNICRLSPPDSAGRQHPILIATASEQSAGQSTRRRAGMADTRIAANTSTQATAQTRQDEKTGSSLPRWPVALLLFAAVLCCLRRWK